MSEILAFASGLLAMLFPGLGAPADPVHPGYVEADYVYAAPLGSGRIAGIAVAEGELVRRGDVLFVLEPGQQAAALAAAEARVRAAEAEGRNLATGSRTEEVDVLRASLRKAEADLALARATLERTEKLSQGGVVPASRLDQDRASLESAEAQADQLRAQLAVAELPARTAQQAAAEANLAAARAEAERARLDLEDRTVRAPADGIVERIYYQAGEMAQAGAPVLALRAPAVVEVKFYVGETERSALAVGQAVAVECDGCPAELTARLTYLAAEPQTTPPVIFSREERRRLVFLAEARLEGTGLLPGQPVSVRLDP